MLGRQLAPNARERAGATRLAGKDLMLRCARGARRVWHTLASTRMDDVVGLTRILLRARPALCGDIEDHAGGVHVITS
jgi:hypothetical protein